MSKKVKIFSGLCFVGIFALLMVFLLYGENFEIIKSLFTKDLSKEQVQDKLASFGVRGYITVGILAMLQVVFTFLPAEPVQVVAGVAFGFPIGLACCVAGVIVGNTVIYILYKVFGDKLNALFDKSLKIDLEKAGSSGKVTLIVFILYFLPAIPYGMICFFAATMRMKYPRYIIVTVLGAIPSVCIGVGLGHVAMNSSWILSICVFLVLVVLLVIMFIKREALFARVNKWMDKKKTSNNSVRKYSPLILHFAYVISRIVFFFKGVKVKYTKNVEKIEGPSIILCNHGSFVDFAYAGTLAREKSPNFIVARLYFFKGIVGRFLRFVGCFPKSMFTSDIESAKNCLRVLKSGGVLAMMPEARLSTSGEFEDIQPGTFDFLKNAKVPIYVVKINGGYLAKPKWGGKMRRGALVEAQLDLLLTKEEVIALSKEEIRERVEKALYFNDFEWLKSHKEVKYSTKKIAKGLENILSVCPFCGGKYTLTSCKASVTCSACGNGAQMNSRYEFKDNIPFESLNLWYKWQSEKIKNEIESNSQYCLKSRVILKHASKDGKSFLRVAGEGECTLNRDGLTYVGTRDNEKVEKHFPMKDIYRLLFGAGENFEIYEGKEIYFFVPEEKRSCVDWYIASKHLKDSAI